MRWPWQTKRKPLTVGMTTYSEQDYLRAYASRTYTAQGAIVDLGCWMGSLTIPLLQGLPHNKAWLAKPMAVHAYDQFVWQTWMDKHYDAKFFVQKPTEGASFVEDFRRAVTPYDTQKMLKTNAGDLTQERWEQGPIELLVVDVMKSWELANVVLKEFYSHLLPGKSYVMHQDFVHHTTPWIHLIHYRLRDYFEPVEEIEDACTYIFKYKHEIPLQILRKGYSVSDFSPDEVRAAFDYSLSLLKSNAVWKNAELFGSQALFFIDQGNDEDARRCLQRATQLGVPLLHGLALAQERLQAKR